MPLLKNVLVMKVHEVQQSQRHVYFQYGLDGDEEREGVYMTRKNWDELGQPTTITVTYEAGHNLDPDEHSKQLLDRIPHSTPQVPLNFGISPTE